MRPPKRNGPRKRMTGRLPEVRITPTVEAALKALEARYPDRATSDVIREAIIEKAARDCK
jgi:hypothetical protein